MTSEEVKAKLAQWHLSDWKIDEGCFSDHSIILEMPASKVGWCDIGSFWGAFKPERMEVYKALGEEGEEAEFILVEMHFDNLVTEVIKEERGSAVH